MPKGCAFAPRCVHRTEICEERSAELEQVDIGHWTRCHHHAELPPLDIRSGAGAQEGIA